MGGQRNSLKVDQSANWGMWLRTPVDPCRPRPLFPTPLCDLLNGRNIISRQSDGRWRKDRERKGLEEHPSFSRRRIFLPFCSAQRRINSIWQGFENAPSGKRRTKRVRDSPVWLDFSWIELLHLFPERHFCPSHLPSKLFFLFKYTLDL